MKAGLLFSAAALTFVMTCGAVTATAQASRVRELRIANAGGSLTLVSPTGVPYPVVLDLSGLASVTDPLDPAAQRSVHLVSYVRNDTLLFTAAPSAPGGSTVVERHIDLPLLAEMAVVTVHVDVPAARVGDAVSVSPRQHLPDGYVISYSTCVTDGTVDIRVVNLSAVCVDLPPVAVTVAVTGH